MSLKLLPEDLTDVPAHLADRYEAQADRYWDLFYRRNSTKFFKDRHYLHKEFPDLVAGPATLLEVGCGVGNTVFPLLEINPALRIHCCDFAPSAIDLVRLNPLYGASGGAVHAFVADITSDMLAAPASEGGCGVPPGGCDLATMIFVLSAIHPQRMAAAVHNVARCLRPGTGRLLFRDYAEGDLAQERLAGGDRPKRLGPNFYVRGDGTRCYYFSQEEVVALFASAGFVCDSLALHERTVVNHKRDIAMDRRWLQAIFTLREPRPPPMPLHLLLAQPPPLQQQQQPPQQPPPQQPHGQQATAAAAGTGGISAAHSGGGGSGGGSGMDVDSGPLHAETAAERTARGAEASTSATSAQCLPAGPLYGSSSSGGGGGGVEDGGGTGGGGGEAGLGSGGGAGLLGGGGSWLTGAAGRLVSHLAAGPGQPSGRALLPDSLDPADDLVAELSPSPRQHLRDQQRQQQSIRQQPHQHCGQHSHQHSGQQHHHQQQQHQQQHQHQHQQHQQHQQAHAGHASTPRAPSHLGAPAAGQRDGCGGGGECAMQVDGQAAAQSAHSLERQLEAEFFATIGRNSEEVAAEEVAAAGAALSRVRLADVADLAAARLAAAAAAASASAANGGAASVALAAARPTRAAEPVGPSGSSGSGDGVRPPAPQPPPSQEVGVALAPGVSFRCLCSVLPSSGSPHIPPATLALARLLLASPRLLSGKCALQLGPAPPPPANPTPPAAAWATGPPHPAPAAAAATAAAAAALPAMAAVRGSARRVVVTEAGRDGLAAAAADLRRNAHAIVIERLRLAPLDWAAAAAAPGAAAAAAGAATGAAGYTYVSGAVRQLRDLLHLQPAGFDLVYAADPLAELTSAAAAAAPVTASSEAAIAAARCLFDVAAQLLQPSGGAASAAPLQPDGGAAAADLRQQASTGGRAGPGGLLLLVFPAEWAAAHGMGFAALAAVRGWELLVPEQLAALYGVDVSAAADGGAAAMGFRRRACL